MPYIRSRKPIIGGTAAVPDFIFDETTTENLDKITREVDMNVSYFTTYPRPIQPTPLVGLENPANLFGKCYKTVDDACRKGGRFGVLH